MREREREREKERSEEKTNIWTDENYKTEIAVLLSCQEINQKLPDLMVSLLM